MVFTSVNDTVTAKDEVRLRDKPSQDTDAAVIATLVNGETITRTGTSSSGWSRLVYNGQTVYAVTSYLTTDLTPKATESPTTGFNTKFTDCNDTVTPKEEVNLRNKPSVTDADSVVVATAKKGGFLPEPAIIQRLAGQELYITDRHFTVLQACFLSNKFKMSGELL